MSRVRAVAVKAGLVVLAAAVAAWALSCLTAVYVGGGSMSPALIAGDLAIARRGTDGIKVGDIVLVYKPGWPDGVLHRVVAVTFDGRLRLRGDANPTPDLDPVPLEQVRGVLVMYLPTGRAVAVFEALARVIQSRLT
jgi:signal peptidase I